MGNTKKINYTIDRALDQIKKTDYNLMILTLYNLNINQIWVRSYSISNEYSIIIGNK